MRVLMLIYHYRPEREGGAERQCRLLSRALTRAGDEVTVLTAASRAATPLEEWDDGVRIVRIPLPERRLAARRAPTSAGLADPPNHGPPPRARRTLSVFGIAAARLLQMLNIRAYARGVRAFVRSDGRWDILHAHTTVWIAGLAAEIGRRHNLPVVCKESTYPVLPDDSARLPFCRHWQRLRLDNHFIAPHEEAAADLRRRGIPDARIAVIPNGVELPDLRERREEEGHVLFVGHFTQGYADKGGDTLIAAWAQVARAQPDARLTLAGAGDPSPAFRQAAALGCEASIMCAGHVAEMATLYRRAAVLAHPSRREGMSNAVLEAQSWGIPVVAGDIPGNRAVVLDGETGVLTPVGNSEALAAALLRLLDDAPQRARMGAAARARIAESFSMESVARRTRAWYERIGRSDK